MLDIIKNLCKINKITIQLLEKNLELSNGSISKWQVSSPKIENIEKVANYFNVSLDYLVGRTDDQTPATSKNLVVAHSNINSKEQQLLDKYKNLDDWGKQRLENFADALLDSSSSLKNNKKQIN